MSALAVFLATAVVTQSAWNGPPPVIAPEAAPLVGEAVSPAGEVYDPSYAAAPGAAAVVGDAPQANLGPPDAQALAPVSPNYSGLPPEGAVPHFEPRAALGAPQAREPVATAPLPQPRPFDPSPAPTGNYENLPPSDNSLAAALVARSLQSPVQGAIAGTPLTLTEALTRTAGNRRQTIERYWQASQKLADYHAALDELARLQEMASPQSREHGALLAAAQATSQAQVEAARVDVVAAQHDLAEAVGTGGGALPLPIERPLVSAYRTRLESLYQGGSPPASLRRIHDLLPLVHQQLQAQAEAVAATEEAVQSVAEAAGRSSISTAQALELHAALRRERRTFFQVTHAYNSYVADYALAVAGDVPPATLAATLVPTPLLPAGQTPVSVVTRGEPSFAAPATHLEHGGWQPQPQAGRITVGEAAPGSGAATRWR